MAPLLASEVVSQGQLSADFAIGADEALGMAVGSFTVDGLTYELRDDGGVELIGASSPAAAYFDHAPFEVPGDSQVVALDVPQAVTYYDVEYPVTSIGAYAFYLSGVAWLKVPAAVADIDERAFRSSDVAWVDVDPANPAYASFDGVLYDASLSRLLLIPGGRGGAVRIPDNAEEVDASTFSHCAGVSAISVDEGSPAFSSWEGLLYDASGTTLLRVPVGTDEVVIRDGCTTIAAGALEGCSHLKRIVAPASVVAISPDVLTSVSSVSLPVVSLVDEPGRSLPASAEPDGQSDASQAPQLTAMVAVLAADDAVPQPSPDAIRVVVPQGADGAPWQDAGFAVERLGEEGAERGLEGTDPASDEGESAIGADDAADADASDAPVATMLSATKYAAQYSVHNYAVGVLWYSNWTTSSSPSGSTPQGQVAGATGYPYPDQWVSYSTAAACVTHWNQELRPSTPYWYTGIGSPVGGVKYATLNGAAFSGGRYLSAASTIWHYNETSPATITWNASWTGGTTPTATSRPALGATVNAPLPTKTGYDFTGWYTAQTGGSKVCGSASSGGTTPAIRSSATYYARFTPHVYTLTIDDQGGSGGSGTVKATYAAALPSVAVPTKVGSAFKGYYTAPDGGGTQYYDASGKGLKNWAETTVTQLYASWERLDFDVSFDVDSEPGDEDYPGDAKDDEVINIADGTVEVENPTRPGYVFQGWVIPNASGTEAIDQELVYEEDGKWYVDASKLPDYATDGKVELTARWTSVISVDVPNSVTFYADTVTQGSESRDGLADRAFGQSKVQSQSQVDLRIVGLESQEAKGDGGSSLGASDVLVSKGASTPADSAWKLFSLYPSKSELTPEELQDPDRVSATPEGGVTFGLDDILLERSFAASDFTIPAGDTLSLGYRLNLDETGTSLDYGKLSALPEGGSAALANISYCFAADDPGFWIDDPVTGETLGLGRIKADAEALSKGYGEAERNGSLEQWKATDPTYLRYKRYMDGQGMGPDGVTRKAGPYFILRMGADGMYYNLQLLGICQDVKDDGTRAGLTFGFMEVYACGAVTGDGTPFGTYVDGDGSSVSTSVMKGGALARNAGSWSASGLRRYLRTVFAGRLPANLRGAIEPVRKVQQAGSDDGLGVQLTPDPSLPASEQNSAETVFLPSMYEVFGPRDPSGCSYANSNADETAANGCFQYEAFLGGNDGSLYNLTARKYFSPTQEGWDSPSATVWWLRSAASNDTGGWGIVTNNGGRNAGQPSTAEWGVVPCFCL